MTAELPVPESFDPHTLVEYVESIILLEDIEHLSITELLDRFPAGQRPEAAEIGLIRSEVRRREDLLDGIYPYRADSAGIYRITTDSRVYDFLLLASLEAAPFRQDRDFTLVNHLFDWLVREALKRHLGAGSEGVRFGTPVSDGRPQDFIEAVTWLAQQMSVPEGRMDRPANDNDGGVDVVAWRHFGDHRAGFPVILGQCTCQLDFELKVGRIPTESWKKWLDIGPQPQTALAVPFSIQIGDDRWMKVTSEEALLFDRIRICELLRGRDLTSYREWDELASFIATQKHTVAVYLEADDRTDPTVARPRKQKVSEYRDMRRR